MAAEQRMFSTDDTLRLIGDKSKESDNFWIKVQRRAHPGAHPVIVATLSGANMQHFASPELWLPTLCGGGKFLLQAYHESDANKLLGGAILFPVDGIDVRDVDLSIFDGNGDSKRADWRGPARLEYPKASAPAQQQEMPMYGIKAPPAPGSGDSATINRQAWPRSAGGGIHREQYDEGSPLGNKAGAIEAERRLLEKEKLDIERDRHRAEIDAIKRSHDSELKSLEARLDAKLTIAKQPTGPDPAMSIFMEMLKQQAEDRRETARQAAEDRRAAELRQQKADERFAQVLEKMSERKERDPLELVAKVAELIKPKGDDTAMMKSVNNIIEMQGTMMGSAMDFVEHASRLAMGGEGGEDEPKWLKGVERLVRGVGKMATAAQVSRPPFPQPPQVASGQQPPQQPPPRPQNQPPAQQQQPQNPQNTALSVIQQIELAIQQKYDVTKIAAALLQFYQDESIQAALEDAGGDFELLVQKRLGNWANQSPENAAYLKKLFEEVQRQVQAAGFSAGPEDGDDGDDGDDDGADDAGDDDQGDDDNDE